MTADWTDVLIHAVEGDIEHKIAGECPRGETPYWEVQGMPQRTGEGQHVWFEQDGSLAATGYITSVEEGRLWFTPLERVDRKPPRDPPSRGFLYIDELDRDFPKECPGNYFGDCVVCGCCEDAFTDGMAVGELTFGDVNRERMYQGLGPICSRECMLQLGFDVLPHRDLDSLRVSQRFRWQPGER